MSNVPSRYDEEINLIDLIYTVWDGKWKILSIIAISLVLVVGINFAKSKPTFTATTDIKSISSLDIKKYSQFNSYIKLIENRQEINYKFQNQENINQQNDILQITQNLLIDLYVDHIEKGSLLEIAVDKFNLLNKENFDSEKDYKEAIQKFVSDIEVLRPTEKNIHHVLRVKYNDKDKWENLLAFINDETNREVKKTIINHFETIISLQKMKRDFAINDLDLEIENAKKDYDRNIKDRLAFLTEQAAIARKLGIKQNRTVYSTVGSQNIILNNVASYAPFYLRGYLPIEEEIKQIKSRKDKSSFIKNLFELEKVKRELQSDQSIKRVVNLFNNTPLYQSGFKAAIVKVATTNYETKNNFFLNYILAIFLGGLIGVFYVLIANTLQNHKNTTLSS